MEGLFFVLILALLACVVSGAVALLKVISLHREVEHLKGQVERVFRRLDANSMVVDETSTNQDAPAAVDSAQEAPPHSTPASREVLLRDVPAVAETAPSPEAAAEPPPAAVPPGPREPDSLEWVLGSKWLGWTGAVMLVLGVGFLLKYAYERDLIGPWGRLAIGVFFGVLLVVAGEWARRRDYKALFQTLTGGGIAIFYLCTFFSFQVYRVVGPHPALALALMITLAAAGLAVFHDAVVIAVLAVIGGFLSTFIFHIGEQRPYLLLSYVVLLDLVALAAAWFRNWRGLAWCAFSGTQLVFWSWLAPAPDWVILTPALLFTALFHLIFLLTPLVFGLVRRDQKALGGLGLVGLNAVFSVLAFHYLLAEDHGLALGALVAGMALGTLLLRGLWCRRLGEPGPMGWCLLIKGLALAILAVPYLLNLYGVPLAWAFEGVLFILWGSRGAKAGGRTVGMVALALAGLALLVRLPLHEDSFLPVFNIAFASWALVVAAMLVAARFLYVQRDPGHAGRFYRWLVPLTMALSLACLLLSLEVAGFWDFSASVWADNYRLGSLCVLWGAFALAAAVSLNRYPGTGWLAMLWIIAAVGWLVFAVSMTNYRHDAPWPFSNPTFAPRLALLLALGWAASHTRRSGFGSNGAGIEGAALVGLVWLADMEISRWARVSDVLTREVGAGLISAAWAILAFILIWRGLVTGPRSRRVFGFLLFAVAALKTVFFDLSEPVYRVISFMALGLFSLAAAYAYQRFRHRLQPAQSHGEDDQ